MSAAPKFILLAGPNGAGKTTLAARLLCDLPHSHFNPDELAAALSPTDPQRSAVAAAHETLRQVDEALAQRRSFAVETTLSGHGYRRRALAAKDRGWQIVLLYVGLSDPELAIQRVRSRVALGGHTVPADHIRRRYERSLANLPHFCRFADFVNVYDNSGPASGPAHLATIQHGTVLKRAVDLPPWAMRALQALGFGLRHTSHPST